MPIRQGLQIARPHYTQGPDPRRRTVEPGIGPTRYEDATPAPTRDRWWLRVTASTNRGCRGGIGIGRVRRLVRFARSGPVSELVLHREDRRLSPVGGEGRFRPLPGVGVVGVDEDPNGDAVGVVPGDRDSVLEEADAERRQVVV